MKQRTASPLDSVQKRCPFYGYRWPDKQSKLIRMGGNECGLDIDGNGPCKMEAEGREVNFCLCEVASAARVYLDVGADRIQFCSEGDSEGMDLEAWTEQVMRWH